jgi:hypothetical protein
MTTIYRYLGMFSQFLPWKEAEWKTSKDIFLTTPNRVRKASDFITSKKNLEFWDLSHCCLVYILSAANRFYRTPPPPKKKENLFVYMENL